MKKMPLLTEDFVFGKDVRENSNITVGGGVRFYTDATSIELAVELETIETVFPCFGSTMVNGIYYRCFDKNTGEILFQNGGVNKEKLSTFHIYKNKIKKELLFEVYFPIANTIKDLYITIPDDANLSSLKQLKKNILFLGGKNTYGYGCVSVNNMFSNIIASELVCDSVNISRADNKFLDINNVINTREYKPLIAVVEIFSEPMNFEYLNDNLKKFLIEVLERNASMKVVLLIDTLSTTSEELEKKKYVETVISDIKIQYKNRVHKVNMKDIWEDEPVENFRFSKELLNDWGNWKIAQYLIPILRSSI